MKLSDIHFNPNNPRVIKDSKFQKLVNSIREFPKMMSLRPMVIDKNNMVLGGNQRLKALHELGFEEIPDDWVKRASDLTPDEIKRFIIVDNISFGEHDFDMLHAEWNLDELSEWGVDLPAFDDISPASSDDTGTEKKRIIVEGKTLTETYELYTELQDRGFKCEIK